MESVQTVVISESYNETIVHFEGNLITMMERVDNDKQSLCQRVNFLIALHSPSSGLAEVQRALQLQP